MPTRTSGESAGTEVLQAYTVSTFAANSVMRVRVSNTTKRKGRSTIKRGGPPQPRVVAEEGTHLDEAPDFDGDERVARPGVGAGDGGAELLRQERGDVGGCHGGGIRPRCGAGFQPALLTGRSSG